MAIAKKPKPKAEVQNHANPIDIDALINKGGSIAITKSTQDETPANKTKQIALHIPMDLFDQLEDIRIKRSVRLPRHTWILEAISEKIDSEQGA